jgi:hypothetical protein
MERLLSMLGAHNATLKSKEILQLETRLANVGGVRVRVRVRVRVCVCVCVLGLGQKRGGEI